MAKPLPTLERLKELLFYCPETGAFTWIKDRQRLKAGTAAGKFDSRGYRSIKIDGVDYRAHRLAWLYVHGVSPRGCVDHINHVIDDNRICNLRDVDLFGNMQNYIKANSNNRSGLLGVSKNGSSFYSEIKVGGKRKYLGTFLTPEEAHAAYVEAKRVLHPTCTI